MDSLLVGIPHSIDLRWSSGCRLNADLRDATTCRSPNPLPWTASSERWTPSDWNAGRDQIRTLDAISSERLDGFRQNLQLTEAVAAYRADYGVSGLFESIPYPGVAQALSDMREAGARLYLATSKRTVFARRILEHLGLDTCFDGIYGSEPDGARDHKPELISYILSRHALPPEGCVMAGDRQYDIAGAHANGMRALGMLWGYGSRDELETVGADGLVVEPSHLPEAALVMAKARIR
jgi:phosphoglycolate phosphatase-like HAD superfamily hydrolase